MPLTLAHPAPVVILRRWFPTACLSALVIGSITPDLFYFFPFGLARRTVHTWAAVLWFCLPVGFCSWVIFERVLKRPLVLLAPDPLRARLLPLLEAPRRDPSILHVALCIAFGALTHIAWDGFTHSSGQFVSWLPVLLDPAMQVSGSPVPIYKVLQHLGSLVGLVVLGAISVRWFRAAPAVAQPPSWPALSAATRWSLWIALVALAGATGLAGAFWQIHHGPVCTDCLQLFVALFVIGALTWMIWLVLLLAAVFTMAERRERALSGVDSARA